MNTVHIYASELILSSLEFNSNNNKKLFPNSKGKSRFFNCQQVWSHIQDSYLSQCWVRKNVQLFRVKNFNHIYISVTFSFLNSYHTTQKTNYHSSTLSWHGHNFWTLVKETDAPYMEVHYICSDAIKKVMYVQIFPDICKSGKFIPL